MTLIGTLREQRNGKYRPSHCLTDKRHRPLADLLRILKGMGYDGALLVNRDGTTERVDLSISFTFRRDVPPEFTASAGQAFGGKE